MIEPYVENSTKYYNLIEQSEKINEDYREVFFTDFGIEGIDNTKKTLLICPEIEFVLTDTNLDCMINFERANEPYIYNMHRIDYRVRLANEDHSTKLFNLCDNDSEEYRDYTLDIGDDLLYEIGMSEESLHEIVSISFNRMLNVKQNNCTIGDVLKMINYYNIEIKYEIVKNRESVREWLAYYVYPELLYKAHYITLERIYDDDGEEGLDKICHTVNYQDGKKCKIYETAFAITYLYDEGL